MVRETALSREFKRSDYLVVRVLGVKKQENRFN